MDKQTVGNLAMLLGAKVKRLVRRGEWQTPGEEFGLEVVMSDGTTQIVWLEADAKVVLEDVEKTKTA